MFVPKKAFDAAILHTLVDIPRYIDVSLEQEPNALYPILEQAGKLTVVRLEQ